MRAWQSLGGIGLMLLATPGLPHAMPLSAERLEWHGKTYELLSAPLEQRYPDRVARPRFMPAPLRAAGTGRGYVGSWRLEDDRLYLVNIDGWLCGDAAVRPDDCRRATLADLFGAAADKPVFAQWYSGELTLPDGALLRDGRSGYGALHERTIRITLKAGKVIHIETTDNARRSGTER